MSMVGSGTPEATGRLVYFGGNLVISLISHLCIQQIGGLGPIQLFRGDEDAMELHVGQPIKT